MRRGRRLALLIVSLGATVAGAAGPEAGGSMPFSIRSPAFSQHGEIPRKYTCQGSDVSPPLSWSEVPAGTKSLALIVHDPDAPDPRAPKRIWVHWVLFAIPPVSGGLAEAAAPGALPEGARSGRNDWGRTGYGGPCPPIGRHRYFFTLYALDATLEGLGAPTRTELEKAMEGHVLATAELIGTYEKSGAGAHSPAGASSP